MEVSPKSFFLTIGSICLFFVFLFLAGTCSFLDSCSKGSLVKPTSGANRILESYPETRRLLETAWTVSQKDPNNNYLEPCFRKLFLADTRSDAFISLNLGFMENKEKAEALGKACKDSSFNARLKDFIDAPTQSNARQIESLLQHYGLIY